MTSLPHITNLKRYNATVEDHLNFELSVSPLPALRRLKLLNIDGTAAAVLGVQSLAIGLNNLNVGKFHPAAAQRRRTNQPR